MNEINLNTDNKTRLETLEKCYNTGVWDMPTVDISNLTKDLIELSIELLRDNEIHDNRMEIMYHDLKIKDMANDQMGRMLREALNDNTRLHQELRDIKNQANPITVSCDDSITSIEHQSEIMSIDECIQCDIKDNKSHLLKKMGIKKNRRR